MTTRPRNSNPRHIEVAIRGSPTAGWISKAPGVAGLGTYQQATGKARPRGRPDDGLPKPQAFSLPLIQTYPTRTATCRRCDELNVHSCARGCCAKLARSHADLLNAIADGICPLGLFTQEL